MNFRSVSVSLAPAIRPLVVRKSRDASLGLLGLVLLIQRADRFAVGVLQVIILITQ